MPGLLSDSVSEGLLAYRSEFMNAKPFKHVVIDNFLDPEFAETLLATFPAVQDPSKLVSEFGTPNPKSARSDVRQLAKPFVQMDDYIQSKEFLDTISAITGIEELCYDPWYYGAGTHENFHGAGLDAHYDFNIHPQTRYHRRLNAIIYLNKNWDPDWRGEISFHSDPWDLDGDVKKPVFPDFNRCVIFETTENSWHSVATVTLPEPSRHISRKSFTIYLYTKSRPQSEIAVEHGTIYVPPPLPSRIKEGRTLDATDMAEIDTNIHRRHQYLKILYDREYRFMRDIEELRTKLNHAQDNGRIFNARLFILKLKILTKSIIGVFYRPLRGNRQ